MRVITKGEEKEYLATCPVCGTDMAYTSRDMKQLTRQRPAIAVPLVVTAEESTVCCPECGTWVKVPTMACRRVEVRRETDWD